MDEKVPENPATKEIHANLRELRKLVQVGMKYESDKDVGIALLDGIDKKLIEHDRHLNWRDEMDSHDHGPVDD